jgi:hypothetical protein
MEILRYGVDDSSEDVLWNVLHYNFVRYVESVTAQVRDRGKFDLLVISEFYVEVSVPLSRVKNAREHHVKSIVIGWCATYILTLNLSPNTTSVRI